MSNNFKDVHEYDGKLKGKYKKMKDSTIESKKHFFNMFLEYISNEHAKNAVRVIIENLDKENGGDNYHPENDIDCSDIFYDIIWHPEVKGMMGVIEEQLFDMQMLGLCNSGRVTRLLQIWKCLYNV